MYDYRMYQYKKSNGVYSAVHKWTKPYNPKSERAYVLAGIITGLLLTLTIFFI